jgi:hypothetical protein
MLMFQPARKLAQYAKICKSSMGCADWSFLPLVLISAVRYAALFGENLQLATLSDIRGRYCLLVMIIENLSPESICFRKMPRLQLSCLPE